MTCLSAASATGTPSRPRTTGPVRTCSSRDSAESLGTDEAPSPGPRAPEVAPPAAVPVAPGRQTRRLIRETRRRIRGRGAAYLLLALAAVLAFAWFCPLTRDATRGASRVVQGEVRRVVEGVGVRLRLPGR
jgi:hypothetical protein